MKITVLVFIFLAKFLTAPGQARPLVLATYTYDTITRLSNLEPLAGILSRATGTTIRVRSYPSVNALIDAIRHDSVDFAMMNTSGYLVFQRKFPGIIRPLVNLDMNDSTGATNYAGCILASRQSGIKTMEDLVKRSVPDSFALVAPSSTSGNLLPRLLLNANGLADPESRFNVYYAGTHKNVVRDVMEGRARAGGCGCTEVERARTSGGLDSKVIVIASYNDIPLGPIVYNRKASKTIVNKARKALLNVHATDPEVFKTFCKGWTEFMNAKQFKKVQDRDYDGFRKMFGDNSGLWRFIE